MWLPLLLLVAPAPGAPAPDGLEAEWRELMALQIDPERARIVTAPFEIADGPLGLRVDRGLLVPVFAGRADDALDPTRARGTRAFVGFVFVSDQARITVRWQDRADHLAFANHMVRNLGHPREGFLDVAHGADWSTSVSEGIVLSVDPEVQRLFLGPDDRAGDPLEVVVYDERPRPGVLDRAAGLFRARLALMTGLGLRPGRWLATDRVAVARGLGSSEGARLVIDVHTDVELGRIDQGADGQSGRVDWLTLLRDPTGELDSRARALLAVLDVDPSGAPVVLPVAAEPFAPSDPADPLSPPAPPVRMEAWDAYVNVVAEPRAADIAVSLTARLKLRAVGGRVQWFELNLPRAGGARAFALESVVRLDGVDLLATNPLVEHDPVLGLGRDAPDPDEDPVDPDEDTPGRGKRERRGRPPRPIPDDPYHDRPESRVTVALPEPLAAGESVVLDVRWRDAWPWAQVLDTELGQVNLGEGTDRQTFLPRLAGAPEGNPSRFRVRVAVPTRSGLRVAASGTLLGTEVDDLWTVVESGNTEHAVPFADVALARFATHDEAPARGLPGVRTRVLRAADGPELAAETRRLVGFYQGFLPAYPWAEHEVFQGPSRVNGYVWVASHELTKVMKARALDISASASLARGGHLASRVFAHELAHQWWGHLVRPAHRDDFWFAETFAEAFACMYLEAAFGACAERVERYRETWEQFEDVHIPRASLTQAYRSPHQPQIVYAYGPYVLHHMLRTRLGSFRYHAALDLLVQDHAHSAITTERIADYLSRAAGEDLGPFFDFWVYGGFVPERVELDWTFADGEVRGAVVTDVPFGTFDVPVRVDGADVWVRVVDGRGELAASVPALPTVELDPDGLVLVRNRIVRGPR